MGSRLIWMEDRERAHAARCARVREWLSSMFDVYLFCLFLTSPPFCVCGIVE